jgi:hypothetical protein
MPSVDHLLDAMDTVYLSDMDAYALMNRVETKYVMGDGDLRELLSRLGHAYRVLSVESLRISDYLTLYFDTQDHECYLQHHNGKLNRRKYRIRQYQSSSACFLEVKTKNNKGRTKKKRIPIDQWEETLSGSSQAFIESVIGASAELVPQLSNSFSRITLVNRSQPERVTLDLNLAFSANGDRQELPNIVIAEVKQERDDRYSPVREHLRQRRVRPLRVSKYCLGTMLLKPHLKSNHFKSKLLAIRAIA